MGRAALRIFCVASCLGGVMASEARLEPARVLEAIRSMKPELSRAVTVSGLKLDLGPASFEIVEGVLVPATPIEGTTPEWSFAGEAWFVLATTDAVESHQIELFTGSPVVRERVTAAVLVVTDDRASATLASRSGDGSPAPAAVDLARATWSSWRASPERRGFGGERALLLDAMGDAAWNSAFAVWCRSERFGSFFFSIVPDATEQAALGRFVPLELGDHEADATQAAIRREQRRGQLGGLRLEDLGDWDTWFRASLLNGDGASQPGDAGIVPVRYAMDVRLGDDPTRLSGRQRVEILATDSGRRAVPFELLSDLKIDKATDASGRTLFVHQDRGRAAVILAEPTRAGETFSIDLEWRGPAIEKVGFGSYAQRATLEWHPRVPGLARARYDVTLRHLKSVGVLASGVRTGGGEADGAVWERRVLDTPSAAFSFEIGAFEVETESVDHVTITFGFIPNPRYPDRNQRDDVRRTVVDALRFYERTFGPYPLDTLTVVAAPRGFSQGMLGFVTLADYLISDERADSGKRGVIAHELAHQWWGNIVGWRNYRDQWLSEALAEYASLMFLHDARRRDENEPEEGRKLEASALREIIAREVSLDLTARNGWSLLSLGPVTMGERLASSVSARAYSTIVYHKGARVLAALGTLIEEEPFIRMLGELARKSAGRDIDTRTFVKALERMSGMSLSTFSSRYVEGVGLADLFYRWEATAKDTGGFVVRGTVVQVASGHAVARLMELPSGGWDVSREFRADFDLDGYRTVVPFAALLMAKPDEKSPVAAAILTRSGRSGMLAVGGPSDTFTIDLPEKPDDFVLDPTKQAMARSRGEEGTPKAAALALGARLRAAGRLEEAESAYRRALEAPLGLRHGARVPSVRDRERAARRLDTEANFGLAEAYLDLGRDAQAKTAVAAAETLLKGPDGGFMAQKRELLAARMELRGGDARSALGRLSRLLVLNFVQKESDTIADSLRRQRFRDGILGSADDYARLAAAAHVVGNQAVRDQAMKEAEWRGADVARLRALATATAAP